MPETWTTAQAAFIVEKPLDVFQKFLERAPVKPKRLQRGGRQLRAFDLRDLVFLSALDDLRQTLTAKTQADLYAALTKARATDEPHQIEIGQLRFDFDPYYRLVQTKIDAADKLFGLIDTSGDNPIIAGTTIEAYRVAALLDGMSVEEILQDYPSLDQRQVLAAKVYAESHPKPGRPYPKTTAKKTMRDALSADAFLPLRR